MEHRHEAEFSGWPGIPWTRQFRCTSHASICMDHPVSLPYCAQAVLLLWGSHGVLETMTTLQFSNYPCYPSYQVIQKSKWLSDTFWKNPALALEETVDIKQFDSLTRDLNCLRYQIVCPECNLSSYDICKPVSANQSVILWNLLYIPVVIITDCTEPAWCRKHSAV